jgi:hypothetical protein
VHLRNKSTEADFRVTVLRVQAVILSTLDERGIIQILPGAGSSVTEFEGRFAVIFLCIISPFVCRGKKSLDQITSRI